MSITAISPIERQATIRPGLYRWSGAVSDIGDATGGDANLYLTMNAATDPALMLWYWITEIWYQMTVVTAQPGMLTINLPDWPEINIGGLSWDIGVPAPNMQANTYGGSTPVAAILTRPLYLGQPVGNANVYLQFQTANTDTMVHQLLVRGFATQIPLDPLNFYQY